MFSFAVPAFADNGIEVKEGYNVDCVPYSPYISSLVVTDNTEEASVYYSASKARTYSAIASTFSATSVSSSDSSTDYIYSWDSFNSLYYPVRNSGWIPSYLIYSSEAGGNIANPYYTLVSDTTIQALHPVLPAEDLSLVDILATKRKQMNFSKIIPLLFI